MTQKLKDQIIDHFIGTGQWKPSNINAKSMKLVESIAKFVENKERTAFNSGKTVGAEEQYKKDREYVTRKEETGQNYFEVAEGTFVKRKDEVGIALFNNIFEWRVLLPNGLVVPVNEKDLTPISPQEFVEAVKPHRFVNNI